MTNFAPNVKAPSIPYRAICRMEMFLSEHVIAYGKHQLIAISVLERDLLHAVIGHLAVFDLKKQSRGAVLGWAWFFVRPAIYIFCFWFAIDIGLKAGRTAPGDAPYILWLSAGIIPWFFMNNMLSGGISVMNRYSYLVNKVKFPLSAISSVYTLSSMFLQLMYQIVLFIIYFY